MSCKKNKPDEEITPNQEIPSYVATFQNHNSQNTPQIKSNQINTICFNSFDNSTWIGTDSGIVVFKNNTWSAITVYNSLLTNNR